MSERIEEKWINIDEAANYLSVKPATVRDWIRKGKTSLPIKSENNGNSNIQSWTLG